MKRIISFLLAIILTIQFFCFTAFSISDSGSPRHIPRIVSVVFDDSGSMYNETDRWAYTSYAMQAFSAMMGSEDVLYVTYLNSASSSKRLDLSKSGKQETINKIENTVFGGGTPNKLQDGANCLTKEYSNYKNNAKYYLVVMADGSLDKGDMATSLSSVAQKTRQALDGADFEAIYFSMKGSLSIPSVVSKSASTGNEIVNVLRDISADIMGRTKVTCSGSGGRVSFDLKYPALSIAVFVQKTNSSFSNVRVPITQNGKSVSFETNTYYLDCPSQINKNQNHTKYTEKNPTSPPYGFVSLITNGSNSVPKGSYTIDLSAYDISNENIVVMVEPAVRIDCKYYIGDSVEPISFDQLKKEIREGDEIRVECGLYEINSDGSSGDPVPLNVLSPEYKLYIDGMPAGKKLTGDDNTYLIEVTQNHENKEFKIEAILNGYQPFTLRENFIEIRKKPIIDINKINSSSNITVTKPEWKNWIESNGKIVFPFTALDSSMLNDISVKVNGADFLPSGNCSKLKNIRIEGNNLIYVPTPVKQLSFSEIPETFSISLSDNVENKVIHTVTVNKVSPAYKFEAVNELEGVTLGLEMLKTNSKGIKFVLCADYNNSGTYIPIKESSCESDIKITLSQGALTGTVTEETGEVYFVPHFDINTDTGVSPTDIVGKDHTVSASATVDGVTVSSENIILSVGNAAYKITVENAVTEPLTLDTINGNDKKIVFTLLADYIGNGSFGAVEEWDYQIFEKLTVNSGSLPGITKTEYDESGKPTGVSFTPDYDENNNNGIVFTKVAGKNHKVIGTLAAFNISAETTVEVLAPKYEIKVQKEGISLIDTKIRLNEEGVEFVVLRNGRPLTKEELEGFSPYQLSFSKEQKWLSIEGESRDGYLFCKPTYAGWTFISPALWSWLCLFKMKHGEMFINFKAGESTASAKMNISYSVPTIIILVIILAVLAAILWITFCYMSRIKFTRGAFYKVVLRKCENKTGYTFSTVNKIRTNKGELSQFLFRKSMFIPFSLQTKKITLLRETAVFKTDKGISHTTFPYSVKENRDKFKRGSISRPLIEKLVNRDRSFYIDKSTLNGSACGDNQIKMGEGVFLIEKSANSNVILFFVSRKMERKLKSKTAKPKKKTAGVKKTVSKKNTLKIKSNKK